MRLSHRLKKWRMQRRPPPAAPITVQCGIRRVLSCSGRYSGGDSVCVWASERKKERGKERNGRERKREKFLFPFSALLLSHTRARARIQPDTLPCPLLPFSLSLSFLFFTFPRLPSLSPFLLLLPLAVPQLRTSSPMAPKTPRKAEAAVPERAESKPLFASVQQHESVRSLLMLAILLLACVIGRRSGSETSAGGERVIE